MSKKTLNRKEIFSLAINVILWTTTIILWIPIIKEKMLLRVWQGMTVRASTTLPTPISDGQKPYEYCVLQEDSGLANKVNAGTPVPMESVSLGPTATVPPTKVATAETPQPNVPVEPTPTFKPTATATQPVYNEIGSWQVTATDMEGFKESNFHVVVIGVGYDQNENESKLRTIISQLEINFTGVRVDFAYVQQPLNLNLEHADQLVDFSNEKDVDKVLAKIRNVHPVDGIVIALDTSLYLGTSDAKHFAMLTGSDPNSLTMATHETAHLMGLGDGYQSYYAERILPNSELFYLDGMPRILSDALPKLDTIPPLYEVGTCNGRKLYQFYESSNNIMGDQNPTGPNSWGDSLFTPLQIQIMNDYIDSLK